MESYLPLLSGFIGAVIGAAASILGIAIQSRMQAKRDRLREAVGLALQDWKTRFDVIKERGGNALPLAVFVHYHAKLLELAEQGKLNPAAIKALSSEQDELIEAVAQVNHEWLGRAHGEQ